MMQAFLEGFSWTVGALAAISLFIALWFSIALVDHLMFPHKDKK
jgi:hypothetical protein